MEPEADHSSTRPLRKRVPLAPERVAGLLESVARAKKEAEGKLHEQQEEAHAARYATPVRILGWLMIGGFAFDLFADQSYGHRLGYVASFFIGLAVLKGSRHALRAAALITVLLATRTLAEIIWTYLHGYPLQTGNKWVEPGSLPFLAFIVSPCVYLIAESVLAICALRLRKVEFWNKPMKIIGSVIGLLMLLGLAIQARNLFREHGVRRDLAGEILAIRAWVLASGGRPNLDRMDPQLIQTLDARKRIKKLFWKDHPLSFKPAYERSEPTSASANGQPFHYSEWLKLSSGEWGKIEMEVILPKTP